MHYLKITLLFFTLQITILSCEKEAMNIENILWVNKERVPCTGLIEQTCYQVQDGPNLGTDWEFFYDGIEGFDDQYEVGFIYKLNVKIEEIENPPADASSLKYTLIEVLSKQ